MCDARCEARCKPRCPKYWKRRPPPSCARSTVRIFAKASARSWKSARPSSAGTMTSIDRVAVIGAGTMGHGIAQVAASAGCEVVLVDTTAELAERGLERIRENLDDGIKRGKIEPAARDEMLARITASAAAESAVAGRQLIVEAVPERMDLKLSI